MQDLNKTISFNERTNPNETVSVLETALFTDIMCYNLRNMPLFLLTPFLGHIAEQNNKKIYLTINCIVGTEEELESTFDILENSVRYN